VPATAGPHGCTRSSSSYHHPGHRRQIFQDDKDRESFLDPLEEILTDMSTSCYAWALIPNHIHLLLRTGGFPLATIMRRLLTGEL
jgi:putative transposase